MTDIGSDGKAKKRSLSILILTGGSAGPRAATAAVPQSVNRAVAPADLFQLDDIVAGALTPVLAKDSKRLLPGCS
jgi:hypothetical protein